jgi:hypothetical protein
MSSGDYLAEAAALLRKAAETNEKTNSGGYSSQLRDTRLAIAMRFAVLGAIERGALPSGLTDDELFERLTERTGC